MRTALRLHSLRQPTSIIVLLVMIVFVGCNQEDPVGDPATSIVAQPAKQTSTDAATAGSSEADGKAPEESDDKRYAGGEPDVGPNTIPADLLEKLKAYRPDSVKTREALNTSIAQMRTKSQWLDESLDRPVEMSLLTADGKNPGPNTESRMLENKALADLLLEDYLQHSDDSEADKKLMTELYNKVILDLVAEREPDHETVWKIWYKFEAGDIDPLVLFLNLSYKNMQSASRRALSVQVPAGLRSRTCSSATFLKLLEVTSFKPGTHSDGEMAWITKSVLVMVPDFLRRRKADEVFTSHAQAMIVRLRDKLRAEGEIDYLRLILQLHEDEPEIVPESLLHRFLAQFYWNIASTARGGRFMYEVSERNIEVFDQFGEIATDHAMAAFTADPSNPYLAKDLLSIELTASSTPFSMPQWYRIAMMTQSDSSYSAGKMAWSLMPRFGGSRDAVQAYTARLIEQAMGAPDNQLVFDKPMDKFMQDQGWFGNIATTTDLYPAVQSFVDHLDKINKGTIDPRLNNLHLVMLLRVLWDAGDLERFIRLVNTCENGVSDGVLVSRYVPPIIATPVVCAYEQEGAPKEAIVTLQQELICGDEYYDEARFKKIDAAIDDLKSYVESFANAVPNDDNDSKEEQDAEAPEDSDWSSELLEVMVSLRETIGTYHDGKEVSLIDDSIPWTAYGNGANGTTVSINSSSIDVQVSCRTSYLLFSQPLRFEMPFEVSLDVTQGKCDADPYGMALFAGQVSLNSTDSDTNGRSLRYSPGYPMIMQDRLPAERLRGASYHEQRLIPVPKKATLKMVVHDDGVKSYVNDKLITDFPDSIDTGGHLQFGRNAGDTFTGVPDKKASYKITGLRIKKLE